MNGCIIFTPASRRRGPAFTCGLRTEARVRVPIENWGLTPTSLGHREGVEIVVTDSREVELEQEDAVAFHCCF